MADEFLLQSTREVHALHMDKNKEQWSVLVFAHAQCTYMGSISQVNSAQTLFYMFLFESLDFGCVDLTWVVCDNGPYSAVLYLLTVK